MIEVITGFQNV